MTGKMLEERCRNRNFDRITVVVRDVFEEMAQMERVQKVLPGALRICSDRSGAKLERNGEEIRYCERRVFYRYANTELCIVEPGEGETLYREFLDRFGEGICCIRERVSADDFIGMEQTFRSRGLVPAQRMETGNQRAFWIDLTETLGILYEVITGDDPDVDDPVRMPERIAQINITTPDLMKTIRTVTEILEIGPWEIGRQSNAVVKNPLFRENGELKDTEFSFLIGILLCGNIEWEIIQPEKGPLVYFDFIKRRGIGFHHVLQEIPKAQWDSRIAQYEKDGIPLACRGTLGPVDWCYMDTEQELKFFMELRTDAVMDRLPDGYVQGFYPEQ